MPDRTFKVPFVLLSMVIVLSDAVANYTLKITRQMTIEYALCDGNSSDLCTT